jgi:hypothetical protein
MGPIYHIRKTPQPPELRGLPDGPVWGGIPWADINHFRPESSSHRPLARCKLLYDDAHLYGLFLVDDRYVRCAHTGFQAPVYEDSCVEIFVRPGTGRGYFNFEFNCGGALLASYVTDPTRSKGRVAEASLFSPEECRQVAVYGALSPMAEHEIEDEVTWPLEFAIPFALLRSYAGGPGQVDGEEWRGNLYKCGDKTSHPHWASWSPLRDRNFHAPWDFGALRFA